MTSNQHGTEPAPLPSTSKKDKAHKFRKAGSKIVKAGVVRPARAVTRVFRSSNSSKGSIDDTALLRKSSSGERGEVEASIQHNGSVALSLNAPNGYGTMHSPNQVLVPNNSMRSAEGMAASGGQGTFRSNYGAVHHDPAAAANTANWPVHSMETLTRQVFLVCVAYMVGAHYPEYLQQVSRASEFAATAWITCIAILCLSFLQRRFPRVFLSERDTHNFMLAAGAVMEEEETIGRGVSGEETVPLLHSPANLQPLPKTSRAVSCPEHPAVGDEYVMPLASESPAIEPSSSWEEASVKSFGLSQAPELQFEHPALAPFYVIDAYSGERIFCNSATPHHISNDWFEMDMLCLLRTPDVDDPSDVRGTPANDTVADYLRGKARRWEFQYRVKLKKKPVDKQVYFACELGEPIKMGMVTKAFASAAMSFMKKTNPTFHYSITGSKETPDGKWESPHMSFTVEGSLDRLVVSKPGEEPPKLGEAILEDPESIKRRKKGELVDWNTEDTYTMALWTSYADFLEWRVLNLPGIRPFALSSMLGTQPINLTMYLIDEKRDTDKHYRRDITEIIKIELSNNRISALGPAAILWKNEHGRRQRPRISSFSQQHSRSASEDSGMLGRTLDFEPIASADDELEIDQTGKTRLSTNTSQDMEDIEEVEEDVLTAAELGEGIYLRSGDSVVLREFSAEDEANAGSCSVANGGGFAVLQEQDVAIVIEKAKKNKKNTLIKSGDTVIFKMIIQHKAGSDEVETRYLTIHRGWWLKWVTTMPTKNGYFTIFTHETELGDKALPTDETQSSFLTLGGTFTLRHKRWSKFHVGIAAEPSTTYGGRLLGIYNPKKGSLREEEKPNYHSDEEDDLEVPSMGKAGWLKPLVLSVHESSTLVEPDLPRANSSMDTDDDAPDLGFVSPTTKIIFSSEHSKADVPAWIEMMDRVGRKRQLAYVVRVTRRLPIEESKLDGDDDGDEGEDQDSPDHHRAFMRLRSGKELAHIMSIGQSVRYPTLALKPYSHCGSFDEDENVEVEYASAEEPHSPVRRLKVSRSEGDEPLSPMGNIRALRHASYTDGMASFDVHSNEERMRRRATADHATDMSLDEDDVEEYDDIEESGYGGYNSDEYVMDECYIDDDSSLSDSASSDDERERRGALKKGKKLLGKSAKLAKKTVVGTGKLTAKTAVGTTKLAASK